MFKISGATIGFLSLIGSLLVALGALNAYTENKFATKAEVQFVTKNVDQMAKEVHDLYVLLIDKKATPESEN